MTRFLFITIGAALGANARYLISLWAANRLESGFPYGTFIVNITGSFLIGFLLTLTTERLVTMSPEFRLLLAVGFLGSYTTFSSYTIESVELLRVGNIWSGLINIIGNNLVGLICVLLGIYAARWFGR